MIQTPIGMTLNRYHHLYNFFHFNYIFLFCLLYKNDYKSVGITPQLFRRPKQIGSFIILYDTKTSKSFLISLRCQLCLLYTNTIFLQENFCIKIV